MIKLISILLLFSLTASAQWGSPVEKGTAFKSFLKRNAVTWACFTVAGVSDAINGVIYADYEDFKRVFPDANDQFCDPRISWTNKYKNHDPLQGPAFWQSTGLLVTFTDLYHTTRTFNHTFLILGGTIRPWGEHMKWYWYFIDFVAGMVVYKGIFTITYNAIRK
jgi:hypothetical protein